MRFDKTEGEAREFPPEESDPLSPLNNAAVSNILFRLDSPFFPDVDVATGGTTAGRT